MLGRRSTAAEGKRHKVIWHVIYASRLYSRAEQRRLLAVLPRKILLASWPASAGQGHELHVHMIFRIIDYEMVQLSGTFGMPSSPSSMPGGRGPIISGGGDPKVCIFRVKIWFDMAKS